jgi:hypothetical protein
LIPKINSIITASKIAIASPIFIAFDPVHDGRMVAAA